MNHENIEEFPEEGNSSQNQDNNPLEDTVTTEENSAKSESQDETLKLKDELVESKDKYLRLYSEFENFRRRTSKEKVEMIGTANEQLMISFLTIADDIERSKASLDSTTDIVVLKEGVDLIFNKFFKTLENKGLKPLEAKGQHFNPDIHEAITQIPAPSEDMKGKIVDEIEKGYFLNEKLIRVAKVVIGA